MAEIKKPNVSCRWCGKQYYACKYCFKKNSWKVYCCSIECYTSYTQKILDLREIELSGKLSSINTLSKKEIENIQNMTLEQALEDTKEDLKDYIQENPALDLNQIIDVVNRDIDNNISKTKSKKRTKQNDK